MTSIRLFEIKLPLAGALSGWRAGDDPDRPYRIGVSATGNEWFATARDIQGLGAAARNADRRFSIARARNTEAENGSLFSRKDPETGLPIIDFGIVDGHAVYLTMFDLPRIKIEGEQAREVLDAFHSIAENTRLLPPGAYPRSRLAR